MFHTRGHNYSVRALPATLVTFQCLQEVTVEERKERSRAAPTIDAMDERKGGRGTLERGDYCSDIAARYFNTRGIITGGSQRRVNSMKKFCQSSYFSGLKSRGEFKE